MALTAESLRNDHRFSGDNITQFLLYLPFGICLFAFRVILALILWVASIILPNKSSVRQMLSTLACWTFGVYVTVSGRRDPRCSTLVANYASCLDSLAAAHALGTISLRRWKVPPFFASALGIRNAAQFVRKEHFGESHSAPLLLQPEGGPSNGRGLLKFHDWPSPMPHIVQPVAIRVERAFTRVTVHGAGAWRDALWFLAAPLTEFRLTLLPAAAAPLQPARALAEHLQIELTDVEYSELNRAPAQRGPEAARAPSAGPAQRELQRRAQQVKEVLPRVPMPDILRDLAVTRSVDVTVTNFLEGVTRYTPEPGPSGSSGASGSSGSSRSPSRCPAPVPVRARSFHERKAQMIADARQRYIDKHGLNLALG